MLQREGAQVALTAVCLLDLRELPAGQGTLAHQSVNPEVMHGHQVAQPRDPPAAVDLARVPGALTRDVARSLARRVFVGMNSGTLVPVQSRAIEGQSITSERAAPTQVLKAAGCSRGNAPPCIQTS